MVNRIPKVPRAPKAPRVVHIFLFIFLIDPSSQHQYDLHKYMDEADLAYHFGVSQSDQVPVYDITTPTFHRAYRDFANYAKEPSWVYPAQIEFDVNAFNRKYRVRAFRNDRLVVPENFVVTFYGKNQKAPVSGDLLDPFFSFPER
jgi:hypothetical protein